MSSPSDWNHALSTDEAPAELPSRHGFGDDHAKTYRHPAFGIARLARVDGSRVLFGSEVSHQHFMQFTICAADLNRRMSEDTFHAQEELAQFYMSEAQFARLITGPNLYAGVPCTLGHLGGKRRPTIPMRQERADFDAELQATMASAVGQIDAAIATITEALGPTVSKKKLDTIMEAMQKVRRTVDDSVPFIVAQHHERMDEREEEAKLEIAASVSHAVQQLGLQTLAASGNPGQTLLGALASHTGAGSNRPALAAGPSGADSAADTAPD